VTGANITFKNCIFRGRAANGANHPLLDSESSTGTITIMDSEFAPSYPSATIDGLSTRNTNIYRANIHGAVDGLKAGDNVTVKDSYIHDLAWFASDPNQGGGATHNDAVQSWVGNVNVSLLHNTLDPGNGGNAAYQVTQDGGRRAYNLRIDGNWLDGGGCTLNFSSKGGPTPMTGIYVDNNRFGRHSVFNCPILLSTQTVLSSNSGNVWDDTGSPIPPPQVHD
jgi:hypothetical protein